MLAVAGYELDASRRYQPETNLWVAERGGGRVRIGYDPLGAETTGDIVAISFAPVGSRLVRGDTFATVEAAKFVGPLAAPVGGTLVAINADVVQAPGRVNVDPLGTWLAELGDVDDVDLDALLTDEASISVWFADAVQRFRREGALAE